MFKLLAIPKWGSSISSLDDHDSCDSCRNFCLIYEKVRNPNEIRVLGLEIWYGIASKTHTNTKVNNHLDLWG